MRYETVGILLLDFDNFQFGVPDKLGLLRRYMHISHRNRYPGFCCILESELFEVVEKNDGFALAGFFIDVFNKLSEFLLRHFLVDHRKRNVFRQDFAEDDPAGRCLNELSVYSYLDIRMFVYDSLRHRRS